MELDQVFHSREEIKKALIKSSSFHKCSNNPKEFIETLEEDLSFVVQCIKILDLQKQQILKQYNEFFKEKTNLNDESNI